MLRIRLQRVGRKHDPQYRVILIEKFRGPKSGKAIEILGNYEPRRKTTNLKRERIDYWCSKGAQVSETVASLLKKKA